MFNVNLRFKQKDMLLYYENPLKIYKSCSSIKTVNEINKTIKINPYGFRSLKIWKSASENETNLPYTRRIERNCYLF